MLTITCDHTGISETFDLADVELREGKRQGEWQFVIKGLEKLQHFAPDAINRELNMVLSKEAKRAWEAKDAELKEQAIADRIQAIEELKGNVQQQTTTTTTNNMNTA